MQRLNYSIKVTQQICIHARNKKQLCSLCFSHQTDILYWKGCTELRGKPCTKSADLVI